MNELVFALAKWWCLRRRSFRIEGPISIHSPIFDQIREFRIIQNKVRAPYLEDTKQLDREVSKKLDERSLHFFAVKDGKLIGTLRLTPAPFEIQDLHPTFSHADLEFPRYLEFGRLCTDHQIENKGEVAALLSIYASVYAFKVYGAKGLLGICKPSVAPFMKKLGVQVSPTSVLLHERQSDYHFLAGAKNDLIRFHLVGLLKRLIKLLWRNHDNRKVKTTS